MNPTKAHRRGHRHKASFNLTNPHALWFDIANPGKELVRNLACTLLEEIYENTFAGC